MSRAFAAGVVFAVVLIYLLTRDDHTPDRNLHIVPRRRTA